MATGAFVGFGRRVAWVSGRRRGVWGGTTRARVRRWWLGWGVGGAGCGQKYSHSGAKMVAWIGGRGARCGQNDSRMGAERVAETCIPHLARPSAASQAGGNIWKKLSPKPSTLYLEEAELTSSCARAVVLRP
eukprot:363563-Chlamydomonas_euryale.AAC.11